MMATQVEPYKDRIWAVGFSNGPDAWKRRHNNAVISITMVQSEGHPVAALIEGWLRYADAHRERFESGIGEDYVLGPAWAKLGVSLRVLLNGELGNLDGGTLDGAIVTTLADEGFTEEGDVQA